MTVTMSLNDLVNLLDDEKSCDTWTKIQSGRKYPGINKMSLEEIQQKNIEIDPVLGEIGFFESRYDELMTTEYRFLHGRHAYHYVREIFYSKHWNTCVNGGFIARDSDAYQMRQSRQSHLTKCAKFLAKRKQKKNPPTLVEFAASKLVSETDYEKACNLKECMKEYIDSYKRLRVGIIELATCQETTNKAVEIMLFIQKHSTFKFVAAGENLGGLWAGERNIQLPITLYTFVPLTDVSMWTRLMVEQLTYLVLGSFKEKSHLVGPGGEKLPTLLINERQLPPDYYSTGFYYTGVEDESLDTGYCWAVTKGNYMRENDEYHTELVKVIALVDDRPTVEDVYLWEEKTNPMGSESRKDSNFGIDLMLGLHSGNTVDKSLTFRCPIKELMPRRYSKTGEGMMFGLDPMHRGFVQGRLPMVDFTGPALEECLSNPYTLGFRVVETFLSGRERFVAVHMFGTKMMILNLCEDESVGLFNRSSPDCENNLREGQHCSKRTPCPCIVDKLESMCPAKKDWFNTHFFLENIDRPVANWTCLLGKLAFNFGGGSNVDSEFEKMKEVERKTAGWRGALDKAAKYSLKAMALLENKYK